MDRATVEAFKCVIRTAGLASLGPGPRHGISPAPILRARIDSLLATKGLSRCRTSLVTSLVLLWHDHLDESHQISQGIESADGAFAHAIMHRREPDYGNAAYWFRRVGLHPVFPDLAKCTQEKLFGQLRRQRLEKIVDDGNWNPFAFIDECERAIRWNDLETLECLREIQLLETELFLEWCLASPDSHD